MDISRMRDGSHGIRMRFLTLKTLFKPSPSLQHRRWNGRLQNRARCNEDYSDVFLNKTEKKEILKIQFFEQK
ncbi:hypothetical protein NC652_003774 [Populus alba x Populus x berolinensis]|nr:hypothetical protein NC652_003774 [Populus alba x Populus x berolinensis]